jgi:hypothetical protein
MFNFTGPIEAKLWLMDYLYDRDDALPDDVRDGLRANVRQISPVKFVVESVKLVFDRLPDCPPSLQEWAAATALMCSSYGLGEIDSDVAEVLRAVV